jgi:hypothetical protein
MKSIRKQGLPIDVVFDDYVGDYTDIILSKDYIDDLLPETPYDFNAYANKISEIIDNLIKEKIISPM